MDFHEYWELIPNNEKYESIGQVSEIRRKIVKNIYEIFLENKIRK
jgi:hypothetical protein